jgi:preprotein translocase subunit YajC
MNKLVLLVGSVFSNLALAEGTATLPAGTQAVAGAAASGGPNAMLAQVVPFALMFGVIYFLMIKPQQKKMKEQQALLAAIKAGDEVLTASGIMGKITEVTDKIVTLEITDRVTMRMLKSQVSQVIKNGQV